MHNQTLKGTIRWQGDPEFFLKVEGVYLDNRLARSTSPLGICPSTTGFRVLSFCIRAVIKAQMSRRFLFLIFPNGNSFSFQFTKEPVIAKTFTRMSELATKNQDESGAKNKQTAAIVPPISSDAMANAVHTVSLQINILVDFIAELLLGFTFFKG